MNIDAIFTLHLLRECYLRHQSDWSKLVCSLLVTHTAHHLISKCRLECKTARGFAGFQASPEDNTVCSLLW